MGYPDAAWERAMTIQEVMLKALSGEWHSFRAAEIFGVVVAAWRRWRERYDTHRHSGFIYKRRLRLPIRPGESERCDTERIPPRTGGSTNYERKRSDHSSNLSANFHKYGGIRPAMHPLPPSVRHRIYESQH